MTRHVLVVDADAGDRDFLAETLDLAGFEVTAAATGVAGLMVARSQDIDLVVLDVMMPRLDGLQTVRRLRSDARTSHLPVLLTTAAGRHRDAVEGLDAGADDTLEKPIPADVLVAHVRAALRRADLQRSLNPLTGLPGNERILTELAARLQLEEPVALLYVDLDQFKPFNDHYGFLRGDEALRALAGLLREVARDTGDEETFLGHVGGDDFVVVVAPELAEPLAKTLCARFDALAPSLYDPDDRRAGGIEVADRRGVPQKFGLLSVSVGVAATISGEVVHHGELVAIATEMKRYAKSHGKPGSSYAVDRRHVGDPVDLEVDLP
ncbi:response regulator [Egicoccus sp. AB-alg6-2]|uniref:response regulator n=1 Tax=Egicoccus sp. AB-alg6-2 TaxID=3242692 RepID=UPI00359F0B42